MSPPPAFLLAPATPARRVGSVPAVRPLAIPASWPPVEPNRAERREGSKDASAADEATLLAGLRRGDEDAYATLIHRLGPYLRSVARRYLDEPHDVEDVLQATYLSAFRGLPRFDAAARLSTWLHRIVANHALMVLRARRRRPETLLDGRSLAAVVDAGRRPRFPDPRDVGGGDLDRRLRRTLASLSPRTRASLRLRLSYGLPLAEIARLLDRTESSVRMHVQRGRPRLRALLGEPAPGRRPAGLDRDEIPAPARSRT